MMRATLMMTQRGLLNRALITNISIKKWDCPRLVLKKLESSVQSAGPFGSSPYALRLARFYSIKGSSSDGVNETKASSVSGFATPNLGGGIIGGNAPSVGDAAAATAAQSKNMGSSSGAGGGSKSSSYGHDDEEAAADAFKKGIATDEAKDPLKKGMATSEMAADQAMMRPGKLGTAEPMDCINPTVLSSAKGGSTGTGSGSASGSSGDQNETKQKSEGAAAPSSINDAVNMANKQLQEIIANSPTKEQVEKYFFRVVAFIYDLSYLLGTWAVRFIEQKIIQNKTVQHYWKRFHEKMEQAKKD